MLLWLRSMVCLGMGLLMCHSQAAPADADALWQTLRAGGNIVLIRHALAPGTGDPSEFTVEECDTQRNLSDEGRAQAVRLGERFASEEVPISQVLTSQWCRCKDTATLAFNEAQQWPVLNSFYADRSTEPAQTAALKRRIIAMREPGNLIMITHQVNISALTGEYATSGEAVVVKAGAGDDIVVLGKIATD